MRDRGSWRIQRGAWWDSGPQGTLAGYWSWRSERRSWVSALFAGSQRKLVLVGQVIWLGGFRLLTVGWAKFFAGAEGVGHEPVRILLW